MINDLDRACIVVHTIFLLIVIKKHETIDFKDWSMNIKVYLSVLFGLLHSQ